MAGTTLPIDVTDFGATALDFQTTVSPRSVILGHANTLGWHEPDPVLTTAMTTTVVGSDTRIDTLEDLAGTGDSLDGTSNRRPYLVADQLNGLSVARFLGDDLEATSSERSQLDITTTFTMSAAHTMVMVCKMTDTTSTGALIGSFTNTTTRSYVDVPGGGGSIRYRVGATEITGTIGTDYFILICGYDGSQYIKMYVDGVRSADVDFAAAGGSVGGGTFKIGSLSTASQFADMDVAAIGLFDVDLFNSSYATLLAAVKSYCASVYGVPAT